MTSLDDRPLRGMAEAAREGEDTDRNAEPGEEDRQRHRENQPSVLEGRSFEGVGRTDGRVGVRDRVLVLPSVICSHAVADRIAAEIPRAVSAPHDHGCAQLGADNDQTRRTFLGLAANPNVAGVVVVGLGCEELQSDSVAAAIAAAGVPVRELSIQGVGGTDACIERGIEATDELVETAPEGAREPTPLSELTIGIVSEDCSPSTVSVADPLVGRLVRAIVTAGGRAVVAGIERFVAHPDDARTAASADARDALATVLERHREQPARATRVRRAAENRPFEDLARPWDGLPITEVLEYGERLADGHGNGANGSDPDGEGQRARDGDDRAAPSSGENDGARAGERGVAVLDAPASFAEAATGLAAAGAHLVVHVTADGVPTGHPVVPVLKVTGDSETAAALPEDIDVDASDVSLEDLAERMLAVAGGDTTCAERHGLTEFAITRVGPSM